jgi:hypothetical protein
MAPGQPLVGIAHVLPGYFEVLKMRVIRGRTLTSTDPRDNPDAAIASESASRLLFPDREPIGGTFDNGRGRTFHVVGVVPDVRQNVRSVPEPLVFAVPNAGRIALTIMVRTSSRSDSILRELQQSLRAISPGARVTTAWWADSIANASDYRNPRFQTLVLGTLGVVGLALTTFGIVGVVGFLVAARTRELGIRAVIGATPGSLVRLVVAQGLVPVAAGLVAGLIATRWASQLAEAQLFEVDTEGVGTLMLTAAVILIATVAAAWFPARRAGRVDPIVVLRAE